MREDAEQRRVHALTCSNGHANAAVELAAIPLCGICGFMIGIAALHDGDNALLGGATKLARDAKEFPIESADHLPGCFDLNQGRVVAQQHAEAVQFRGALIARCFALHAPVESFQIRIGLHGERVLPINKRTLRIVRSPSRDARES